MNNRPSRQDNHRSRRFILRHGTLLSVLLVLGVAVALSAVLAGAKGTKKGESPTAGVESRRSAKPAMRPLVVPPAVTVSLPDICAGAGSDITVPITVGDLTGQGVQAYDLQVTF